MEDSKEGRGTEAETRAQSVLSEKITRRHLPHWQLAGATYFLTWRCFDGIILSETERDIVLSAIRHWDGIRWEVLAAVVMPDHVHVLACPLEKTGYGRWDVGELLHSVKSFSAHQITKQREPSGTVGPASRRSFSIWQDERYDRWMRDDDEVIEKCSYILGNPVKTGLVSRSDDYRWLYTNRAGGTAKQRSQQPIHLPTRVDRLISLQNLSAPLTPHQTHA